MKAKYTIRDFEKEFPDDDACLEWLKGFLYPHGIECRKCGKVTKHHRVKSRKSYSCDLCGHHVHPTAGTIYHKSSTPLRLWFHALFLMSSTRCGISAKQLERQLGVTYKTAWRMFNKIRSMLAEGGKLSGEVEVDEMYMGGKKTEKQGGKRGRGAKHKKIVVGAVERGGPVRASVAPDVKASTLMPFVQKHVLPGTMIYTDELRSYNKLGELGFYHRRIRHNARVWVSGSVHTNSIEGFWSLFKRGVDGVYHAVSAKYLQNYLDEYSFRYNRRASAVPMFQHFLAQHDQLDWWTPYIKR